MAKRMLALFLVLFLSFNDCFFAFADVATASDLSTQQDEEVDLIDFQVYDEDSEIQLLAASAGGAVGYVPFSTAFFSAAAALGITAGTLATALSAEKLSDALTSAQASVKKAMINSGAVKTLSNGAQVVKSYVANKINYFSKSFLDAVSEALNSQGLFASTSGSFSVTEKYGTIKLTPDNFYSASEILSIPYAKYVFDDSAYVYWKDVVIPTLNANFGDDYVLSKIYSYNLQSRNYAYFIKKSDIESFPILNYSFVKSGGITIQQYLKLPKITVYSCSIPSSSDFASGSEFVISSSEVSTYTSTYWVYDNTSFTLLETSTYFCKPLGEFSIISPWSVTSNIPTFTVSGAVDALPTWKDSTISVPAGTISDADEDEKAYPVTIPAGDKALKDGLTADDIKNLTQDEAQTGSIDTSTDITDLADVIDAISGAKEETASGFSTLWGWLQKILDALTSLPSKIFAAFQALLQGISDLVETIPATIKSFGQAIVDGVAAVRDAVISIPDAIVKAWQVAFPATGEATTTETMSISAVAEWAADFWDWMTGYIVLPADLFEKVPFCIPYDMYLLLKGMLSASSVQTSNEAVSISNNPSEIGITIDIPVIERTYDASVEEEYAPVFNIDLTFPYHDVNGEAKTINIKEKADLHKFNYLAKCIKFSIAVAWMLGIFNFVTKVFGA